MDETMNRSTGSEEEMPAAAPSPRRRRSARYQEEAAEAEAVRQPESVLETGSETAREVASRYRQRQEADAPEGTVRVPAQRERMTGAPNRSAMAGRRDREQVGYAPGQMGVSPAQRARVSAAGRARLAEESQYREQRPTERPAAFGAGKPGSGTSAARTDPRYGGRPVQTARPADLSSRRKGKGPVILLICLLLAVVLAAGFLLIPKDMAGPLGDLKRRFTGGDGENRTEASQVLSFEMVQQTEMPEGIDVTFEAVTERQVADLRLVDGEGSILPMRLSSLWEEKITWTLIWHAEEDYQGPVRLQIQQNSAWVDTGFETEVTVMPSLVTPPPVTEAPTEIPVVFATEEVTPSPTPAPTETPTAVPTLAAEEEAWLDAEQEGAGEDISPVEEEPEKQPEEAEAETAEEFPEDADAVPAEALPEDADLPEDGNETGDAVPETESIGENPEAETAEAAGMIPAQETPAEAAAAAPGTEAPAETAAPTPRPILTAEAAENADPGLIATTVVYNGARKVSQYARADSEKIHMPVVGEYTKQMLGVLTFRTDAFRQNGAVGTVKGTDSLTQAWKAETGSVKGSGQTYYGMGWVGQPAIVKWSKEVRELSEMYDTKKEVSGLKEVIAAGLDGRIYFLDLSDGTATRNSIKLGYPMKGTPSVHPGGAPYMNVGQFARKMASRTGTIGLRQYNLYQLKELSLIDGLDGKNNRPYNGVGSFETSALMDRTSGTMVTAGTNGMLYVITLNADFDYAAGTYSQSPTTVAMKTKAKGEKDAATAVEASVAMYDRYVFYADMGGFLRCVDTNNMKVVWAISLGDAVESTPALDWHGEEIQEGLDLYTATLLSSRKKGDAAVTCLDAMSGEIRWTASFPVKKDTKNKTVSGFRASPVIGQEGLREYVYYTVNNLSPEGQEQLGVEETAALVALRKSDGTVAWAKGLAAKTYSSPVAVYDGEGNGAVIQCAGDGTVLMLDGLTGDQKAELQVDGAIEASPAVYGGMMVVGTTEKGNNYLYGIRIE